MASKRTNKSFTEQLDDYVSSQIKWRAWGSAAGLVLGLVYYGFRSIDSSRPVDDQDAPQSARVVEDTPSATPRKNRREADIEFALGRMHHESPAQRCDATIILARLKANEAIEPLRDMLRRNSEEPFVRTCAASALMTLGDREVAPGYYRAWIQSDDSQLFDAANRAYALLGPEAAGDALPLLTIVARSGSPSRRRDILRTLAAIGPAAEPLLTELAADSDPWVKKKAAEALATLK